MIQSNEPKSEGDDSALRRFINSTHINPLFIDESLAEEENDDDEDYEPTELEKLSMMDEDEYVEYMANYIKEYKKSRDK